MFKLDPNKSQPNKIDLFADLERNKRWLYLKNGIIKIYIWFFEVFPRG